MVRNANETISTASLLTDFHSTVARMRHVAPPRRRPAAALWSHAAAGDTDAAEDGDENGDRVK